MWPTPRAPISATSTRVCGSRRSAVIGSPTSVLNDPSGASVRPYAGSTWASRSFVLVLPDEPVTPTTTTSGSRSRTARARRPSAATVSSTTTHGTSSSRDARTATAPEAIADSA